MTTKRLQYDLLLIRSTVTIGLINYLSNMRKIIYLLLLMALMTSCNYQMYYVKQDASGVPKKESYQVKYKTDISVGEHAKIAYTDSNGKKQVLKNVSGSWAQSANLKTGSDVMFKVHVKQKMQKTLVSSITVGDTVLADQTQTGKNILFRSAFKLP